MLQLYLLLTFMILGAVVAVETRDLLSSVIAVGAVGFGVTLAFLILQAPDLAIVQVVVEILTLVIMIAAILKTTRVDTTARKRMGVVEGISLLSLLLFVIVSAYTFRSLPKFGEPLMRVAKTHLETGLEKTGATNLVAAVILDFRGYDTLGEATVLFTSVIGVLAILRKKGRKGIDERDDTNS